MGVLSYPHLKNEVIENIRERFEEGSTVLDIGAGDGVYSSMLRDKFIVDGIEIFEPWVEKYDLKNKYRNLFIADLKDFSFEWYDIVIMGDVLEHLSVEEAQKVIEYIYPRCKELLIAVPYQYEQGLADDGNIYQIHKQPDLTYDLFIQRYPGMELLYNATFDGEDKYGYFIKKQPIPEENKNLKIGVYAICKNEKHFVDRFLKYTLEADLIFILDTGSTDGTWELLKYYASKYDNLIVDQQIITPWRFDTARNISMHALPDYIDIAVAIDIDEYFDLGWTNIIRRSWEKDSFRFQCKWEEHGT